MSEAAEAPTVREAQLTRPDGRTLAWVEAGVLDGRPILRLPGTPGSRLQVRPDQSPWLDRGLRMILTERPGFGASTRHPGRGFLDHADDLAAIFDELGLDRVPIIGGSGAGPYLLALAARHPDRVQAVTVAVGAAPIEDEEAELMIGLNAQGYWLAKAGDRDGMTALLAPVVSRDHGDRSAVGPGDHERPGLAGLPQAWADGGPPARNRRLGGRVDADVQRLA